MVLVGNCAGALRAALLKLLRRKVSRNGKIVMRIIRQPKTEAVAVVKHGKMHLIAPTNPIIAVSGEPNLLLDIILFIGPLVPHKELLMEQTPRLIG